MLALAVERDRIPVLADDQVGDQARAVDAAVDDLVATRRADHLRLAVATGEQLALIETHDDLGGDELDHRGRIVTDARSLASADRAGSLLWRHGDRIDDAAQARWRWPSHGRLLVGLGLVRVVLLATAVLLRRVLELRVGLSQLTAHRGEQLVQEQIELVARDALAPILLSHLAEKQLELRVARHELGHDFDELVAVPARE